MSEKGYTILENSILEDEKLTIHEQSILIAIISYFNKEKGYSYPSYSQLKRRSKIADNRTLNKCVNSLIEKGYINKETIKGLGCKYYVLEPSGELHLVENYTSCNNTPPPSGELHHDLVENYTTTNTNTITNTNTNNISKDIFSSTRVQPIIEKWNSLGLQKIIKVNQGTNRYKLLNARIKEYGMESVVAAIENIEESSFLKGQNNRNWIITFDWFIRPNNFIKVLEGNYNDIKPKEIQKEKSLLDLF